MNNPTMNTEPLEWDWDQTVSRAQSIWDGLTEDDLDVAEGDYPTLLARIATCTGQTKDQVVTRLNQHDPN